MKFMGASEVFFVSNLWRNNGNAIDREESADDMTLCIIPAILDIVQLLISGNRGFVEDFIGLWTEKREEFDLNENRPRLNEHQRVQQPIKNLLNEILYANYTTVVLRTGKSAK